MKQGWNILKLSDACTLTMGQSPISESCNTDGDGLPFFQGCSDFGKINPTIRTYCNAPTKIAEANDVLMSVRAPIGTLNIANVKCCIGRGLASFRATSRTTNSYLYYFLKHSRTKLESLGTGSTFKAIGKDALSKFPIPVPPIEEQKAICSLLDKMNRVIEAKKEQLKELDNLAQAIFYDMFGDPITNTKGWVLSTIDNISTDKLSYGSGASAVEYDGLTRYVRITDINDLGDLNEDIKSPSEIDEKYLLREGDILFARSGATVGKTYCHREKNGRCIYAGYLIKMRPDKSKVMPKYVFYYTKSEYYKAFIKNAQNAVAQPNINAKQYGGLVVPIPPLPLQQAFAEKVKAIEQQKELINQSIKDVQTLFDAKMDYYFGD